jgi:hypothetical protein
LKEVEQIMAVNLQQKGIEALTQMPDKHLPVIVRWLELLAATNDNPDVAASFFDILNENDDTEQSPTDEEE